MNGKDAGVTLIEALMALAVVAMLAAFGIPSFNAALDRTRVTGTLHLLSADMAMARSSAIMRRDQVVVCPRDATGGCNAISDWSLGWLVFTDPDGNRRPDKADDILRSTDAPARRHLRMPSSRPFLRYQADGRSAHSNLTVHLCRDGRLSGNVIVNNLGRVRTERPTRDTACPRG